MKYKKILITGGSGMVGMSLKKIIPEAVYISSQDYNLTSEIEVEKMMNEIKPDCIIHLAAKVGGIFDNMQKPAEYYTENVLMNTILVDKAYKHGVKRLIAMLSTCIYPDKNETYPLVEGDLHKGPPAETNFSYGYAKRSLAVQIDSYNKQYGTKYQYLTPCNLYGEFDKYGSNSHFIAALIKKIHVSVKNGDDKIVLFGDGTPLRQFMYSDDLAFVIKECLDKNIYENMNVATEEIYNIKQMALIALEACQAENLTIHFDTNSPNGQFRKDVSVSKLKKIIPHFNPINLSDGIKKTYKYLLDNNKL